MLDGCARFVDAHTLAIDGRDDTERRVQANGVVIATGSTPAHPPEIEFDGATVLDSDDIVLRLAKLPSTIVIVGAGVIGVEFASMFAALGSRVTIVDARGEMLDFCDPEITEALRYHLRELNVVFRFGERVEKVEAREGGTLTTLASGKVIPADVVFYSAGRVGASPICSSRTPVSRPTRADASRSTRTTGRRCRTSMPSATSSGSRASRRRPQSRDGSRRAISSACRPRRRGAAPDRDLLDPGDQLRRARPSRS